MGTPRLMSSSVTLLMLLLALLVVSGRTAPTSETATPSCVRGCRCTALPEPHGALSVNCSSPAAAAALGAGPLGSHVRELRLTRHDDHLSVKEGAFHSLTALRSLYLDHLGLVKVYPGAFRGLDALEELDLSHNALSAGDEVSRALRDLPQLRRLYLRGNNFGSANGVAPTLISRTLKFVDLGCCKLRDLPPFVLGGLSHVRHVVLDGNFIRQFKAISFPRSIVSLDLSHNDIDRISLKELNELENVDAIELADNPLHCSCDLWQISYDYNINKEIICASPKQLMGKNLLSLKKHQLCGVHKKIKREAGNELDDETLSGEETADNLEEGSLLDEENKKDTVSNTGHEEKSGSQHEHTENSPDNLDKTSLEEKDNSDLKQEGGDTEAEEVEDIEGDEAGPELIYGEESAEPVAHDKNQEKSHLEGDRLTSGDKSEPTDEDKESPEELVFETEKKHTPVDEQIDDEYDQSKVNAEDTPGYEKPDNTEDKETVDGDSPIDGSGVAEENSDEKIESNDGSVVGTKDDVADTVNEDGVDENVPLTDDSEDSKDSWGAGAPTNVESAVEDKVDEGESDKNEDDFEDAANEEENPPDSLPASEYTRMQAAQDLEDKKNDEANIEEDDGEETLTAGVLSNVSHDNVEETRAEKENTEEKSTLEGSNSEDENLLANVGPAESETKSEENEKTPSSSNEKLEIPSDKIESEKSEIPEPDENENSELPDGEIVETVEDNENVVHTDDVGARLEDESESSERKEEVDGAESGSSTADKENGDIEAETLDEIEAKIEADEADLVEKEKDYIEKEIAEGDERPDDEIGNETLEKELEEDRLHSTLGHGDLAQENDSEREPSIEDSETHGPAEKDAVEHIAEEKSASENLPVTNDNEEKENINENEDDNADSENDEDNDGFIPHVASEMDGATDEKDYEEIKEGGKDLAAPGDSMSIGEDAEESDEVEGSGTGVDTPVNEIVGTHANTNDWSDDNVNEPENDAVPPLDNAESNEERDEVDDGKSQEKSEASEVQHGEVIVGGENENEEEGSGVGLLDRIPLDGGDEEPASNENDDGSGMLLPPVHVPDDKEEEEEEEEESSSNGPFIPIVPVFHDTSDSRKPVVNSEETEDKDITPFIPAEVEEDSIPRRKVPVHSAPPRPHDTHDENAKEHEHPDKDGRGLLPVGKVEDDSVDPVSAPDDVDSEVEGADDVLGKNENVLAAIPDTDSSADGSEALNKEGIFNFNTIASYVVLGAIMLLVVILLAYAVCRSRRQKSATAKDKDVENPGREMLDVNKPLINNHHPSAPEKQPLDETQQPLMTKEQEASLSLEPSEKIPLTQDETDHKPKQNGEVVVEQRPIANGKAASPATVRAPSPAALSAAPPPAPVAPAPATTDAPSAPAAPAAPAAPVAPASSPPRSPAHSPVADGHMNGNALPLANGGTHTPPRAASPSASALPASSPASGQPPVSPGAVRVVAKELPDSVAKRPVIIMNRGAEPAQQV